MNGGGAPDGEAGGSDRQRILDLVREFRSPTPTSFVPGATPVPIAGTSFGSDELVTLVDCCLDMRLAAGRYVGGFEEQLARQIGVGHALLCNSGSSANLLAVAALTSPLLGTRRLRPGDEVITSALGFPTTVNPLLQHGLVPVFVDVEPGTWNADPAAVAAAVGNRTRAIVLAHILGNPFHLDAVLDVAARHGLWVIEDVCEALGSTYGGAPLGSFAHLATTSFYPAHHIAMGEGGAVLTDDPLLATIVRSFRDWGRDCWCPPGTDDVCGRRFRCDVESLPADYDHKFVFSHLGYNLKATEMQAAVGLAQLRRVDDFASARRRNWQRLYDGLSDLDCFLLCTVTPDSSPSWFGFALVVRPDAGFTRRELVAHLEGQAIATRPLLGSNLLRQPAYRDVPHRVVGSLDTADMATEGGVWVGVFPGLTNVMLDHVIDSIRAFVSGARGPTAGSTGR